MQAKITLALLGFCIALVTSASEVQQAQISFIGNTYRYAFTIEIDAPVDAVLEVVTDYNNLERINDSVVQGEIIEHYNIRRLKRRMLLNHCILVFCFDLVFVEDVELFDDGSITTTILPAESNFRRGFSNWRAEAISDRTTRISVDAEQEPDFWIPPVIGPLLFKRAFMKEVHKTAANIEREANRVRAK